MTSKRQKWMIAMTSALVIAVLSAMLPNRADGPTYKKKTLKEWLEIYSTESIDPMTGLPTRHDGESGKAICAMGTNALPKLLEWTAFDWPQNGARHWVGGFLRKLPFVANDGGVARWARFERESNLSLAASAAFGALGNNAQPAIPELARRMNSTHSPIAFNAICALRQIGVPAVPVLLAHLANTNAQNRSMVALQFGWTPSLATNDARVVSQLLSCLNESNPLLEEYSALSLYQIALCCAPQPDIVVPALIKKLPRTKGIRTQPALVNTLGVYGPEAHPAVPILQEMLNDQNEAARVRATNALIKIAPEALTNTPAQ